MRSSEEEQHKCAEASDRTSPAPPHTFLLHITPNPYHPSMGPAYRSTVFLIQLPPPS